MLLKPDEEIWMPIDCIETQIDLHKYLPIALQMKASFLLSGISQDTMRALYAQFDMSNYVISTIASLNQAMYLLIEKSHTEKYKWFI